jgi:hypothetical protein
LPRELGRLLIPQRTVQPLFIELLLPRRDLPPCIPQILEPTHVQALVPQLAVTTFHESILLRLPWLDVHQLDLPLDTPGQKMTAGELRPVVAGDRRRLFPLIDDRLQRPRHSPARKLVSTSSVRHSRAHSSPRVFVHHVQHANRPATGHRIVRGSSASGSGR